MPRKPTTRDTFPTADDYAGACARADTIIAHYQKARGDRPGTFYGDAAGVAIIVRAIADLVTLAQFRYPIACERAAAEGDNQPANGGGAEYVTNEGLSLAMRLIRQKPLREAYAAWYGIDGKPPASIF